MNLVHTASKQQVLEVSNNDHRCYYQKHQHKPPCSYHTRK